MSRTLRLLTCRPAMSECQETAREVMEREFPWKPGSCTGIGISSDVPEQGIGGASRDRTDDLFHAMEALSQLSYGPIRAAGNYAPPRVLSSLTGQRCERNPRAVQDAACARARAASKRASVRSRPSKASVASMGGETAVPVTATRTGCAILPRPLCRLVARSLSAV
jgi:hypothetical protein